MAHFPLVVLPSAVLILDIVQAVEGRYPQPFIERNPEQSGQ